MYLVKHLFKTSAPAVHQNPTRWPPPVLPGRLLVIFYGDHSTMWVRPEEVVAAEEPGAEVDADVARALRAWGRQRRK